MICADHWLMASRAQVDNGQAPMPNAHIALYPVTFSIWAAMCDGIGHLLEDNRRDRLAIQVN
jgi:hypothetical protein